MSSPEQLAQTIEISTIVPEPASGSAAAVALVEAPWRDNPTRACKRCSSGFAWSAAFC
jgi:hypothetical protein